MSESSVGDDASIFGRSCWQKLRVFDDPLQKFECNFVRKTVDILDEIFKFGWKIVAEGCTEFSWNSFPFNKKVFKILDWRAIDSVSQIAPLQIKNHY